MNKQTLLALVLGFCVPAAWAADTTPAPGFKPTEVTSTGAVTVGGSHIDYRAIAGTLVVRADSDSGATPEDDKSDSPEASMFFVAYFKNGVAVADRPITFL